MLAYVKAEMTVNLLAELKDSMKALEMVPNLVDLWVAARAVWRESTRANVLGTTRVDQ